MNSSENTNKKLVLIDPYSSGHHIDYASNVLKAAEECFDEVVLICDDSMEKHFLGKVSSIRQLTIEVGSGFMATERARLRYVLELNKLVQELEPDVIHFLYLDRLIRSLVCLNINKNIKIFATLHWFYMLPEFNFGFKNRIKSTFEMACLQLLKFKGLKVVTHSKKGAIKLIDHDKHTLDYPIEEVMNIEQNQIDLFRQKLGLASSDKLVLCFGGTRFDKGSDIAVKALAQLGSNYHLVVAGKEECISYQSLKDIAVKYGCENNLHCFNGFVTDEDASLYFNACDIILVPYRKIFSGQSGPLTIGASLNKGVVCSNVLVLDELVKRFNLGVSFESENIKDCVSKIQRLCDKGNIIDNQNYIEAHSTSKFIDKQKRIYSDIDS